MQPLSCNLVCTCKYSSGGPPVLRQIIRSYRIGEQAGQQAAQGGVGSRRIVPCSPRTRNSIVYLTQRWRRYSGGWRRYGCAEKNIADSCNIFSLWMYARSQRIYGPPYKVLNGAFNDRGNA